MARYKFLTNSQGICGVKDKEKGGLIPLDPDNVDYEEYLEWAKKNTTDLCKHFLFPKAMPHGELEMHYQHRPRTVEAHVSCV